MKSKNWAISKKRGYLLKSLAEEVAQEYGLDYNKVKNELNNRLRDMESLNNSRYNDTKFRILNETNELRDELRSSINLERVR